VVTQGTASEALHTDEMMPAHAPARHLWRSSAIVGLKLVHSAIFLVNSVAITHIFVAGIRDRPSRWTGPALAVALAESTVFLANRGRCPLTSVAEGTGAESGRVSDIFLPRWCADRIPQLCAPRCLSACLPWPSTVGDTRRAARRPILSSSSEHRPRGRCGAVPCAGYYDAPISLPPSAPAMTTTHGGSFQSASSPNATTASPKSARSLIALVQTGL